MSTSIIKITILSGLSLYAVTCDPLRTRAYTATDLSLEKSCTVPSEELEVFAKYLNVGSASPQIVVSVTEKTPSQIEKVNFKLTKNRRDFPLDLAADFTNRNKTPCAISALGPIANVQFISLDEYDSIFRMGWHKFHRKYGRFAELVWLSRAGFNADGTMALLHVSYGTEKSGGDSALYIFDRRENTWTLKSCIRTWPVETSVAYSGDQSTQ